jgi:hypothetical protein
MQMQTTSIQFKQIIGGLRYDTSKAKHLGDAKRKGKDWANIPAEPCWLIVGSLYVTPNGRFFCLQGDGRVGSESFYPMSKEEALEWAETELDDATLEANFGDVLQDA